MNTVLIVEDDVNIQNILAYNLENSDFKVFTAETGVEAIEILKEEEDISVVLMDVMMPGMDGFECTRKIREFSNIPIIMITALEDESDVLQGFECGADDYVTKPFSIRQVIARVNAHLRRPVATTELKNPILNVNNIVLNTLNNEVTIEGKKSELTDIEYKLFMYFYENPNKVLDRNTLLDEVWGTTYADARTVDVNIRRLREKVEVEDSNPQNIRTKRGKGYYLALR